MKKGQERQLRLTPTATPTQVVFRHVKVGCVTDPQTGTPKLLFICTGNYYRSRFAEMLFNALARAAYLQWIAESRGIAPERVAGSRPISIDAVRGLASRGIDDETDYRYPEKVREHDLISDRLVIGLNERGHRWYLEGNFPAWKGEVEYWPIEDVGLTLASIRKLLKNKEKAGTRSLPPLFLSRPYLLGY